MVTFVIGRVLENRKEDLKVLERDVTKLESVKAPFHRMTYDEAVVKLQAKGSEIQWGGDFGNTDETLLTEDMDRPVMVDRYPSEVKAFYFAPAPDRPEVALGVDFIAPEGYGEIIGGGQRIHDLDLLKKRLDGLRFLLHFGVCSICISTSASSAPSCTPALAWVSSGLCPGCAAWNIFARRSRFRRCCIEPGLSSWTCNLKAWKFT